MKKIFVIAAIMLVSTVVQSRYVVETIKAVIHGEDKDDVAIITQMDITRRGIGGEVQSLQDRIFSKLLWFEGKKYRILPTEEDIERHLKIVERENNISRKQLIEIFTTNGWTLEEGKEQFAEMYTANSVVQFKVSGGLFVSTKEVQTFYDENPEWIDAIYTLQRGLIPYNYTQTKKEQLQIINEAIAHKKDIPGVQWSPAFTIKQDQIATDKKFLLDMKDGEISTPVDIFEGFEVFKVVQCSPRRLKTLDERYAQIADMLRRPKYQEILTNYKKQLYDNASIIYF